MKRRTMGTIIAFALITILVAVAAGCGGTTTTTAGTTATTAEAGATPAANGADVFATVCSACHGADGTGGSGPDLTARANLTKERIVDQVTNGGTQMPAYGSKLSADEIGAVADYVLSDIVK